MRVEERLRGNRIPSSVLAVLNDAVNCYKEIYGIKLKKVLLYGSYAKGNYNPINSDIDVLILASAHETENIVR